MPFDNFITYAQAQSGPLSLFFGRKKRGKYLLHMLRQNTTARITDGHPHTITLDKSLYSNLALIADGLDGIDQKN